MTPHIDQQQLRFSERERSLTEARAALRIERAQLASDRAEAERLLAELQDAHVEATRERNRARKLAPRFVRWVKHRHAAYQHQLGEQEQRLAVEREKVADEFAKLINLRSEFHAAAAATRDRLRDAWAAVEAQQQRAGTDWTEAERYYADQAAQLDARGTELVEREKAVADQRARGESETIGLREEATALEARVENARAALAELEAQRDRVRAELLGTDTSALTAFANRGAADLAEREAVLAREKTAVAALQGSLERETAEITDRKRMLAEQFRLLAAARAKWQVAERKTVIEMEEMARDLKQREADLDGRERRLIRADARRRDDAYDLWQLRLRLEAWQTKLTAFEVRWHSERGQLESDLERRLGVLTQRENEAEKTFAKWEKARASERERLRAELEFWVADREKMARAAAEIDLQRQIHNAELSTYAARALAAEELVAAALQDSGSERMKRRLAVLRKRWERLFDRKVKEIDSRRTQVAAELTALTDRYQELHSLLKNVSEREAATNNTEATADLHKVAAESEPARQPAVVVPELDALRAELERVAVFMLDMELPDVQGPPDQDLPWGTEVELDSPASVFQFDSSARAA